MVCLEGSLIPLDRTPSFRPTILPLEEVDLLWVSEAPLPGPLERERLRSGPEGGGIFSGEPEEGTGETEESLDLPEEGGPRTRETGDGGSGTSTSR